MATVSGNTREKEVVAMIKHSLFALVFFVALGCGGAEAQNLCPPGVVSDKLICLVPQVYGINGLVLPNNGVDPHFQNVLPDNLRPLNSAIARQSALLPLASPSSGLTYTWDSDAKVFTYSTDSFGPVFGERAETIGKYKTFIGLDYQHFAFNSIDGLDMKNLPIVFTQPDDSVAVQGRTCSINSPGTPGNTGPCGFIRDVIHANNRIDLTIDQVTTFLTFGLTNRLDVSVAIPMESIKMRVSSTATIVNSSKTFSHQFNQQGCIFPCFTDSFSNTGRATGMGDIVLRVKGTMWRNEHAALAAGVDVRLPTGDAANFLGAGTAGIKPFVVWSRQSRISPHVLVGFETNGSSLLAGDISVGSKEKFPGQLTYSAGADMRVTKRLTAAFDVVGQEVFQAGRVIVTPFTEPAACQDSFCGECPQLPPGGCSANFDPPKTSPSISQRTGSYNVSNASVGMKVRPFSNLLVTGNVILKLNDGGLRYTAAPLIGISYAF
jgi:hypothetical protein